MRGLIFGSTASKYFFPDFREPKDLDILTPEIKMTKEEQYYWFGPSSEYILANNKHPEYVDPEFLLTIKMAHAAWNVHWEKTMADIVFFQRKGLKMNVELYKLLMKDFTEHYGKKWATLKDKDSDSFFKDAVKRKYVHDTIHEAVAYYERPLYESILTNDKTVLCSKAKFELLSLDDQLKLAKEEVFVTALERFLIPQDFKFSKQRAYWLSLKKFITTMSSGFMRKFLIENYDALAINKDDYVSKFQQNQHKLQYATN